MFQTTNQSRYIQWILARNHAKSSNPDCFQESLEFQSEPGASFALSHSNQHKAPDRVAALVKASAARNPLQQEVSHILIEKVLIDGRARGNWKI